MRFIELYLACHYSCLAKRNGSDVYALPVVQSRVPSVHEGERASRMNISKFARVFLGARGRLKCGVRSVGHASTMWDKQPQIPPPKELLKPINVPFKHLFGPGPTNPSTRIYNACAMNMLGHFHAEFFQIMDEVKAGLQYLFQTKNKYTLTITGAGHAAMETALMNLLERGEKVLVCVNGLWGLRASDVAERQGEEWNKTMCCCYLGGSSCPPNDKP